MSLLQIFAEGDPETLLDERCTGAEIAEVLRPIGVLFERWPSKAGLAGGASQEAVLEAYAAEVRQLGYPAVDVVSVAPDHPQRAAMREQFLREHTHSDDEVRFFASGRGLFYLHAAGRVHLLLCETGDLIRVPAGTRHWFDMGAEPSFAAIRCFRNPEGWVASFTEEDLVPRFPRMEFLLERERESVVLVDIEGTLSPIAFVRQVLFPYAREAMPRFVECHGGSEAVRVVLEETRKAAGLDPGDVQGAIARLLAWSDADEKRPPLKELQGLVWEAGFRDGTLVAPLYADARERLELWHAAGVPLHVFSSGSVQAQKLFFAHTDAGDLSSWFAGHFDTRVGTKADPRSYHSIAKMVGKPESQVLFLSDSSAEIEAARQAGMRACWVQRPEDAPETPPGARGEASVQTLRDVAL